MYSLANLDVPHPLSLAAWANTIELGIDPNNWETGLDDAMAGGNYDILIAGTWQMIGFMASRVHKYPDKTFMFFESKDLSRL